MFGVVLGYEIKNGKLGKALRDTTISGVAYDVLKTVTMVSDQLWWSNGGMAARNRLSQLAWADRPSGVRSLRRAIIMNRHDEAAHLALVHC